MAWPGHGVRVVVQFFKDACRTPVGSSDDVCAPSRPSSESHLVTQHKCSGVFQMSVDWRHIPCSGIQASPMKRVERHRALTHLHNPG